MSSEKERGILVGVVLDGDDAAEVEESLDELEKLADTAGVVIVGRTTQNRSKPDSGYYIGRGKAEELAAMVKELKADVVIFDNELSPAQNRNLEEELDTKVIDRSVLILDIFAQRAHTKAAQLEVELAQLEYMMPRLVRRWTHLSRIVGAGPGGGVGGVGARGPGETQLQIDRRIIRIRISALRKELANVERKRQVQRSRRADVFSAALVGYTNAGKSTLLNKIANENLLAEDKLFATLDPTTRAIRLPGNRRMIISDTVGFIRKLPHQLIASFKATLEEVIEADLLIHVADASHPQVEAQIEAVSEVLRELGVDETPTLIVFNKIDKLEDQSTLDLLQMNYPDSVAISATTGAGIDELFARLCDWLVMNEVIVRFKLPYSNGRAINYIHDHGVVLERKYLDNHVVLKARMDRNEAAKLRRFVER